MDIDTLLKSYNVDVSERPPCNMRLVCPSCGTYYSDNTAPDTSLDIINDSVKEYYYCDCHGEATLLNCCYEVGQCTPSMQWEKEKLNLVLVKLEKQTNAILKELENYY